MKWQAFNDDGVVANLLPALGAAAAQGNRHLPTRVILSAEYRKIDTQLYKELVQLTQTMKGVVSQPPAATCCTAAAPPPRSHMTQS